ncbi:MAG: hypothetical protein WCR58_03190 [Bacteroidales bacterium]|jgi:hypothetical protein|nr:hypothetical protein [Bacteroidales bacterium]MDY0368432.1 hypothetical protein [Bacteroidales bacterium]
MAKFIQPIHGIGTEIKKYINLRLAYLSMQLSHRISGLLSSVITTLILLFLVAVVVLMLSFAFVFWYGAKVGTYYHGFLIVSLAYVLVGLLIYSNRRKLFIEPMIRRFNQQIMIEFDSDLMAGMADLPSPDMQLEVLKRQIELSEQTIESSLDAFAQKLHPANLIKELLGSRFTGQALTISLLELLIKRLRRSKKSSSDDDLSASDS